MKKLILIAMIAALSSQAQNTTAKCDSITQGISYSTISHTFCTNGTRPIVGEAWNLWVRISCQNIDTSTSVFYVNGGTQIKSSSIIFKPDTVAGITTFTLSGTGYDYQGNECPQTITWNFVTKVCDFLYSEPISTVGIADYQLNEPEPVYYSLYGDRIEKQYNTVIIEQRGLNRRKIYIQQ